MSDGADNRIQEIPVRAKNSGTQIHFFHSSRGRSTSISVVSGNQFLVELEPVFFPRIITVAGITIMSIGLTRTLECFEQVGSRQLQGADRIPGKVLFASALPTTRDRVTPELDIKASVSLFGMESYKLFRKRK